MPTKTMRSVPIALTVAFLGTAVDALANGEPVPTAAPLPPTRFERFIRQACSPCVQESQGVKTVAVSPVKFPRLPGMTQSAELSSRLGQIGLEVLRASELNRPTRRLLALRVNLLAGMSGTGQQFFPLGVGMVDADDVPDLVHAVGEIAKAASGPPRDAAAQAVDTDYRVGSLRIGFVQLGRDALAYVQVGDIALIAQRPAWQVPTTLFMTASELAAFGAALSDSLAKIRTLRES